MVQPIIDFNQACARIDFTGDTSEPRASWRTKSIAKICLAFYACFGSRISNNALERYFKDHSNDIYGGRSPSRSTIARCAELLMKTTYNNIPLIRKDGYGYISNFSLNSDDGKDVFQRIEYYMKLRLQEDMKTYKPKKKKRRT